MGLRNLEDLKTKGSLTYQQKIGLNYYNEFLERIPRAEIDTLWKYIIDICTKIDIDIKGIICGSYRRGRKDCGDIDILLTHKRAKSLDGFLSQLVEELHKIGFLTDDLVKMRTESKYMGVCKLPGIESALHRRIDIKIIPKNEWGCALLYFTGSGHFNRSIRLWARKCGMSLSEHSLVRRYPGDEKGEPIPIKNEIDIFKVLGLEYKNPEERDY